MESIISIVFSGVLGSLLTYFFGVRKLRTEAELRIKTERYENLIKYLSGFTGRAANADTKRKFFSEWEKSWLYCSDEVFENVMRLIRHVKQKYEQLVLDEDGKEIMGDIIKSMRKDLLRKKTDIPSKDFIFWEVRD